MWPRRQRRREDQPSLDPARLVFIGETGTTTNMVRSRGRAPRATGWSVGFCIVTGSSFVGAALRRGDCPVCYRP